VSLDGWIIIVSDGITLLGHPRGEWLEPVYELQCVMQLVQPDPRAPPQLMTMRNVKPVLTFPSVRRVAMPIGGVRVMLDQLSSKERTELERGVRACDELMAQMRAQESGIVLAPAGARIK
jgi:hypothetical protein